MLWMLPLAGAAGGALLNKKDPLKGAAIGGLLGGGGMLAAPAMGIGAAETAATATTATPIASSPVASAFGGEMFSATPAASGAMVPAGPTSGLGAAGSGSGASPGLLSQFNSAAEKYKPSINAAAMGTTIGRNLTPQQQQTPTPQMPQGNGSNQLSQLYQQSQQTYLTPLQQAAAARQQRRTIWGQS